MASSVFPYLKYWVIASFNILAHVINFSFKKSFNDVVDFILF